LQWRIVLFFLVLLLIVQGAAYVVLEQFSRRVAQAEIDWQLDNAERVFHNTLGQIRQQLEVAATVLASDFAFKEAVATRDINTVVSALGNHGTRINADMMLLIALDDRVLADTRQNRRADEKFEYPDMTRQALERGTAYGIGVMRDGNAYQLVTLPVMAPQPIAQVAMGFTIDEKFAKSLRDTLGLQISFVRIDHNGTGTLLGSSLPDQARRQLAERLPEVVDMARARQGGQIKSAALALDAESYETRVQLLTEGRETQVIALLQKARSETLNAFSTLATLFGFLALASIALFAVGSLFIARKIARPINELALAAGKIERGDYSSPIGLMGRDEIGALALSLNHMREAIARREERILELAYHDTLTRLPNRARFNILLQETLAQAAVAGRTVSVLVMDLNGFKHVNDSFGHQAGDRVLVEVARRLNGLLRQQDLLARLGGDEFAIMMEGAGVQVATLLAQRIVNALDAEPVVVEGEEVDIGTSIGVAVFPEHGSNAIELMRKADVAMYGAKQANSGVAVYDPRQGQDAQNYLPLLRDLRSALAESQFRLFLQAKVALDSTNRVVGAEALIRWRHPTRGLVPPGEFIPFAERTGFILQLSQWVLAEAARILARWQAAGLDLSLAVNLTSQDLHASGLADGLARVLQEIGAPADKLTIEITESGFMQDPQTALATLNALHGMGVRIAIDDFGTGYSSLSYLQRLPVDELKVDGSFVQAMAQNPDDAAIVRSTIELGHNLAMTVVAEGVEDLAALALLRDMGCDLAQGFALCHPLPVEEFEEWVARRGGTSL
jgi:diguanylate cyclase (GGDEF)-like protein